MVIMQLNGLPSIIFKIRKNTCIKKYVNIQQLLCQLLVLCMIGAAGAIDGGYKGIPMNDNWFACASLFFLGVASFILALYSQVLYSEQK